MQDDAELPFAVSVKGMEAERSDDTQILECAGVIEDADAVDVFSADIWPPFAYGSFAFLITTLQLL